jgi:hypothetical protein
VEKSTPESTFSKFNKTSPHTSILNFIPFINFLHHPLKISQTASKLPENLPLHKFREDEKLLKLNSTKTHVCR